MEKSENSSSANEARPWQSYHTVYTNCKAGMEGVDKEKVQRVVYEMSKGSKYFENEERKEAAMRQKIERMRGQCAKLSAADISHYQMVAEKRIVELETARDLSRIWLHVDMDAFYAAVETICNPSLKGKPMAVGSMSMLSTANYEARKYGVRAAMPGFIARKLCPDLTFVPTDFKKYNHYSDLTRKVFRKYDPNFIAGSLDEAYLDITNVCKDRCLSSGEIAEELRASVYEETGLTCSAGVAPNRLLAKVCSDVNKPNGQFVLPNDRMAVMTFISSLPIRKIGGIGKVTEHILKDAFGISTCKDILEKGGLVCAFFSHSTADFFLSVGIGLGSTDTPEVRSRKSISNERTFSATGDKAILHKKLAELAELLSSDMQKEGLSGRTLTLKLKTASFELRTRAITLQQYICSTEDILKYASKLLKDELPASLRLIGLRISQFNEEKDGGPVDPAQKPITNFIVPGEAYRKRKGDQSLSLTENTDDLVMNGVESGLPSDRYQNDFRDTSDDHHLSDLNLYNTTLHGNADDLDNGHAILNDCASNDNLSDMVDNCKGSDLPEGSELLEVGSSRQVNCDNLNKPSILKNEMASLSNEEQLLWVDGYKCSLCGTELPPSFIEERQEHSDFHIAERLQREESSNASSSLMPRPRIVQKDHNAGQGRRKKLKASREGRHIPIDLFFVKKDPNS